MPVILLILRECNSYGYELVGRAAEFGFEAVNSGTVYRTLKQMEESGSVQSSWEISKRGGPARHMYSITDEGEDQLTFWAQALEQYQTAIERFFGSIRGFQL